MNDYTKKRPGFIVKTKTGKIGRTYHDEDKGHGKIRVYVMVNYELTGEKLLCDPKTLEQVGFID